MATFQLTISPEYVSDWGIYEGVREVIQNALDARDIGHELFIGHTGRHLRVSSRGARLQRNVWLMGQTTKAGDDSQRGHFGEGLKLGALALARAGRHIRFLNGEESWTPLIAPSKEFGQDVLTIRTRHLPRAAEDFIVEVQITLAEWQSFRDRFLDFQDTTAIKTTSGQVLMEPKFRGQSYVKGIWVEGDDNLQYGYNYLHALTDRDRRMVNSYDAKYGRVKLWEQLFNHFEESREAFTDSVGSESVAQQVLDLLGSGKQDLCYYEFATPDRGLLACVGQLFRDAHGATAIPVHSGSDYKEAGHYGRVGILSSKLLCDFFNGSDLDLHQIKKSEVGAVAQAYTIADLTESERVIFLRGMGLVGGAGLALELAPLLGRVSIVDFSSPTILGTHHTATGAIKVSRRSLESMEAFLSVLVHELAHDCGTDGSVEHDRMQAAIWAKAAVSLMQQPTPPAFAAATACISAN